MQKKRKTKKRFKYCSVIMLVPAILYGLLCPLELFNGNQSEFLFGSKDFIFTFLLGFAAIWLIASLLLSIMPNKIFNALTTLIFAFGILSYIQYIFLNKTLATDDGSAVDWNAIKSETIINSIIWILIFLVIISLPFIIKKAYRKLFYYFSIFAILIQLVAVVSLLFTSRFDSGLDNKYEILSDKQYELGNEENVIVLILDKYGNLEFDEMLSKDEHFADCLKDFTYYKDMNSTYAYTTPVFAYIFTGKEGLELSHYEKYRHLLDEAWASDESKERFSLIKDAGYERDLFTLDYGHIYVDAKCFEDIFDNMGHIKLQTDRGLLFRLFLKTAIFKCSPTIIKPKFETMYYSYQGVVNYLDGKPCDYYNYDYYAGLKNNGLYLSDEIKKKFIVEHVSGAHDANIDAEGNEYITKEESKEDRENLQKGLMLMLDEYFNQLKSLGVYDSSTVIVMSDHGGEYKNCDPQPIFFIKPANQHFDNMQVNNAPVSSEDIMPTIMYHMGIDDYSEYGKRIYDWSEADKRERSCGYPENDYEPFVYTGNKYELVDIMKKTPQKHILTQTIEEVE